MQTYSKEPITIVGSVDAQVSYEGQTAQWPTCMMTSRTRAGVKVRQLAIEKVWGIPNVC